MQPGNRDTEAPAVGLEQAHQEAVLRKNRPEHRRMKTGGREGRRGLGRICVVFKQQDYGY